MIELKNYEVWFVTGSQHLYGDEALKQVAEHSQKIARGIIPIRKTSGEGCFQAGCDHTRGDLRAVFRKPITPGIASA